LSRAPFILNVAAKVLLLGLMGFALANPDWPQFAGKGMGARAPFYLLSTVLIPVGWVVLRRRTPYPHDADILLVSPFIVDTVGNYLGLYDRLVWFDDVAHTVTWMLLVLAVGALILRLGLPAWNTAALCIGFGAASHIFWEIGEYVIMNTGATGLQLTYGDTIGDLAMSFTGSATAGLVTGWRSDRRRSLGQDLERGVSSDRPAEPRVPRQ
jgi:hypothetical protein